MTPIEGIGGAADAAGMGAIPLMPVMPTMRDEAQGPATKDVGGFETMLTRAVNGLSGTLSTADHMSELAATGELADPTTAILAVEEADLAMQMATQVRNRVLDSWSTINSMTI